MPGMSLARVWRRQLYAASSVALIVPAALLAALVALALGGGFSQVGVLGQIFAGPPPLSPGAEAGGHAGTPLRSLPVIGPGAAVAARGPAVRPGAGSGGGSRRVAALGPGAVGPIRSGGALTGGGGAAPIVIGGRGGGAATPPARPAPATPTGSSPPAGPSPPSPPQPTPVDHVVKLITSVTEQVPAPAGPIATQAVQSAGSAADSLLPGGGTPPGPPVP
jgi:hypothetical protein